MDSNNFGNQEIAISGKDYVDGAVATGATVGAYHAIPAAGRLMVKQLGLKGAGELYSTAMNSSLPKATRIIAGTTLGRNLAKGAVTTAFDYELPHIVNGITNFLDAPENTKIATNDLAQYSPGKHGEPGVITYVDDAVQTAKNTGKRLVKYQQNRYEKILKKATEKRQKAEADRKEKKQQQIKQKQQNQRIEEARRNFNYGDLFGSF